MNGSFVIDSLLEQFPHRLAESLGFNLAIYFAQRRAQIA
jgi:hypothetical protein